MADSNQIPAAVNAYNVINADRLKTKESILSVINGDTNNYNVFKTTTAGSVIPVLDNFYKNALNTVAAPAAITTPTPAPALASNSINNTYSSVVGNLNSIIEQKTTTPGTAPVAAAPPAPAAQPAPAQPAPAPVAQTAPAPATTPDKVITLGTLSQPAPILGAQIAVPVQVPVPVPVPVPVLIQVPVILNQMPVPIIQDSYNNTYNGQENAFSENVSLYTNFFNDVFLPSLFPDIEQNELVS